MNKEITYDGLIDEYQQVIKQYYNCHADDALLRMLKEHKEDIKKIMQFLNDDPSGFSFHKAFRQIDVTDSANHDMVFWNLLHASKWFFYTIKEYHELKKWSL